MNRIEAIAAVDHLLELLAFEPAFHAVTERQSSNLFAELSGFSTQIYFKERLADTYEAFSAWLHANRGSPFDPDPDAMRMIVEEELKELRFAITFGDSILELDDNTFTIVPPTATRSSTWIY